LNPAILSTREVAGHGRTQITYCTRSAGNSPDASVTGNDATLTRLFISHGGGPLPLLGDPGHAELVLTLQRIARELPRPSAIIVASAHWEAPQPTVTTGAAPELFYDYYGFPPESYAIEYPAPGYPALAQKVLDALQGAGLAAQADAGRGFDHGLFVPLKILYPEADIPCIQLSLLASMDPEAHVRMGRALAALDGEGVLLIGSGSSFHNVQAFFGQREPALYTRNRAFEDWLVDTLAEAPLEDAEREARLLQWENAPHARFCHPREEHLLPLLVCAGVAPGPATRVWRFGSMGMQGSCFAW
jgi:aromatic ring-opening dioxygenase catalytic subunit (LigB family)